MDSFRSANVHQRASQALNGQFGLCRLWHQPSVFRFHVEPLRRRRFMSPVKDLLPVRVRLNTCDSGHSQTRAKLANNLAQAAPALTEQQRSPGHDGVHCDHRRCRRSLRPCEGSGRAGRRTQEARACWVSDQGTRFVLPHPACSMETIGNRVAEICQQPLPMWATGQRSGCFAHALHFRSRGTGFQSVILAGHRRTILASRRGPTGWRSWG